MDQNGAKYIRVKPPLGVAEAGNGNIRARLRRAGGCRNLIWPLIKALRLNTITTQLAVPPVSQVRFSVSPFPPEKPIRWKIRDFTSKCFHMSADIGTSLDRAHCFPV